LTENICIDLASLRSPHLLKVQIQTVSAEECNKNFLYLPNREKKIAQGILNDLMVCAGNPEGGNDTCQVSNLCSYSNNYISTL